MNLLLVLHPTSFCNLDCKYCWAPNRDDTASISHDMVEAALSQAAAGPRVDRIDLCWLTGEPLIMGLDHFSRAISAYDKAISADQHGRFVVQTNGTLLTPKWAEFFAEHGFTVGVSVDGPRHIHDRQRPNKGGRSSFDLTLKGIEHLERAGVKGGALRVISRATLDYPARDLFDFFQDRGISWSYLLDAAIGENIAGGTALTLSDRGQLRDYLSELMDLSGSHPKSYIRDFDQLSRRLYGSFDESDDFNNLGCLDILNVMANGDFFWGNPELMTATSTSLRHLRGNRANDDLWAIRKRPEFVAFEEETHRGIQRCHDECEFFGNCLGGNPAHKYYEHGTCDASVHTTCRLNDQIITGLMREKLSAEATA